MIRLINERGYYDHGYDDYDYSEYTDPIHVTRVNVYVTAVDDTGYKFKTDYEIPNNDGLSIDKFFDYVNKNLDPFIKQVEDEENITVLSIDEFAVYDDRDFSEPTYFDKVDDLYDFLG